MKNKSLYWDTTYNAFDFPPSIKKQYFDISLKNRSKYTEWIGKISKNYKKNLDWWLTGPVSRNPFISSIHEKISILETLERIKKNYSKINIKVKSRNLSNIILKWSQKEKFNISISVLNKDEKPNKILPIIKAFTFHFIIFCYIKIFIKKKKFDKNRKIILIDVFQTIAKYKKNFANIEKYQIDDKKEIFFVPTFVSDKDILKVFSIINSIEFRNYIFKEHYISLRDFFFCFFDFFKKRKFFQNKFNKYRKWDLSSLINEEIYNNDHFSSIFIAKINYQFSKNLFNSKIKISKTINWFENQIIDKGWNYGFRKFFLKSESIGYQGITHYAQYMNTIPTRYEEDAKVIPQKIFTIGRAYKNLKKEFFSKAKIGIAPALDYQFLFKNYPKKTKNKYLVILSGIEYLDKKILEWVSFSLKKEKKLKFVIKPHPILPIEKLNINLNNFSEKRISFYNGKLYKILQNTYLVICSGPTSATLESLAFNCYLILPIFDPCDEINLKKLNISKNSYKFVHNKSNFLSELKKIKLKKNKKPTQINVINYLFEKINKRNIKIFF